MLSSDESLWRSSVTERTDLRCKPLLATQQDYCDVYVDAQAGFMKKLFISFI